MITPVCGLLSLIFWTMDNLRLWLYYCMSSSLLPIYRDRPTPKGVQYMDTLDTFSQFYVSKFADHHTFKIGY